MKKEKTVDIEDILSLSRGEKKPTIADKFWNIAEKVSIVFMIALGGSFVYTMVNSNYKTNGVEKDRFMQNIFRVPITLPLTNKDIKVMIDDNFSSEQKQCIKNAVEELDVELTGVTYKVELKEEWFKVEEKANGTAKIVFDFPKDYGFALKTLTDLGINVVALELLY